jgi:hypothetical protein
MSAQQRRRTRNLHTGNQQPSGSTHFIPQDAACALTTMQQAVETGLHHLMLEGGISIL